MEVIRIIGIGLAAALASVLLKQYKPELAAAIPLLAAAAIFGILAPYLEALVAMFKDIAAQTGIDGEYVSLALKIVGVAYLCQFAADTCRDAGETSLANKVETGGKILILTLSMPIVYQLLQMISRMIHF